VKTVKVHRARMLSKMNVRSVAELVQLAQKVGIAGAIPILVRQAQRGTWPENPSRTSASI
jgi:hypothetical protein